MPENRHADIGLPDPEPAPRDIREFDTGMSQLMRMTAERRFF